MVAAKCRRVLATGLTLLCALALSACDDNAAPTPRAEPAPGHDHATHSHVSLAIGDGTSAKEVGYTLRGLRLPSKVGTPGTLRFVVDSFQGRPQTRFLKEQTKLMHVYVVRKDLSIFRHVHPTMSDGGTWTSRLTLPEAGEYQVVTEFVAEDEGGNGDHVILGDRADMGRASKAVDLPAASDTATSQGVTARVTGELTAGKDGGALDVAISRDGETASALEQYLGTFAHVTGFHAGNGAVVHMHPLGAPFEQAGRSTLSFHATFPEPGDYRVFIQVRLDGFLHTIPITVAAS